MSKFKSYFLSILFIVSTMSIFLISSTIGLILAFSFGNLLGTILPFPWVLDARVFSLLVFLAILMFNKNVRVEGQKEMKKNFEPLLKRFANLGK